MNIGPRIQYNAENAEQASFLENAVNDLPVRIFTEKHATVGDKSRIFVRWDKPTVTIRPYRCRIVDVELPEDADLTSTHSLKTEPKNWEFDYGNQKYAISDIPQYYSEWD